MGFGAVARVVAVAGMMAIGGLSSPLSADTLTEAAERIQSLLDQGEGEQAMRAARAFLREVTDETGFGVTNARLTAGPATGFGVFTPRPDNVYAPGEPVFAYVEVYGFTLTPESGDVSQMMFDVSFTLDSPDGAQMTEDMVPMGEIMLQSYSQPIDGYFHLTYRISGAEGVFNLRTHVIDRATGDSADFVLPVEFATPEDEDK
jgi:hypothetical protein